MAEARTVERKKPVKLLCRCNRKNAAEVSNHGLTTDFLAGVGPPWSSYIELDYELDLHRFVTSSVTDLATIGLSGWTIAIFDDTNCYENPIRRLRSIYSSWASAPRLITGQFGRLIVERFREYRRQQRLRAKFFVRCPVRILPNFKRTLSMQVL